MSSSWPRFTIGELIESGTIRVHKDGNHGSKYPRASEFGLNGIPFLTARLLDESGDIAFENAPRLAKEKAKEFTFGFIETNDVLLSHNATVGRVAIVPEIKEPVLIGTSLTHFRLDIDHLLPRYLAAFFSGRDFQNQLASVMSQSTRNQVPITSQRKLSIVLPPIEDQRVIADSLGRLDNKRRLNLLTNQTLEQIARTIFQSWFVDFEPVKAKIVAKERWLAMQPANESSSPTCHADELAELPSLEIYSNRAAMQAISGKNEAELNRMEAEQPEQYATLRDTAELFPSAMQDSELGDIPEGWAARPFGELLEKTIGGDWGKEEPDEKHTEIVKILRGTDLPRVYAGDDGKVPTRYVEPKKLKTRSLKPGDIVIEVSGGSKGQPTGRSLFLTSRLLKRLGTCEPASFCRLFRPKDQETGLLLGLHLQHIYSEGKTWLYQNQSTGISNFQTKIFLEHELVATPSAKVIRSFYERAIPLINRIHGNESVVLAEIRDALLPKLLSGKISVTAEEQYPEAMEPCDV